MAIKVSLDTAEIAPRILEVYQQTGRSISATAVALGKDRTTVRKVIRAYESGEWNGQPIIETPAAGRADNTIIGGDDWKAAFREWASQNGVPVPPELQERPAVAPKPSFPSSAPVIYWPDKFKRIITISDVHLRYEDKVAVQLVFKLVADLKPDAIVLAGDIFDFYSISDFDRDPGRAGTIQDEFDEGRYFLKAINDLTPTVFYIEGNHEERLFRVIRRNPGLYKLRSLDFRQAAELPSGWHWFPDQTHLHIDGCAYLHGNVKGVSERVAHPASALYRQLKISLVCGHYHRSSRHWEVHYHGGMDKVTSNGHLSDVRQAKYIVNPRWQKSITMTEYGQGGFEHYQFFVEDDAIIAPGKEYVL